MESYLASSYSNLISSNCAYLIPIAIILATTYLLIRTENSKLKFYLKYSIFVICFSLLSVIPFIVGTIRPRNMKNYILYGWFAVPMSRLVGLKCEIRNSENMPKDGIGAIIVANHQSMFDALGHFYVWYALSAPSTIVVRKEFFWMWPFGLAMWLNGTLFIDRRPGSEETKQQLQETCDTIRNKNIKVWFYVEGTRNSKPENLLAFKKGAFKMAIDAQVPVVPVVFSPYYFLSHEKKYFNSGKIILTILDPIPTKNLTAADTDDLMNKTYEVMSRKNTEIRNEVLSSVNTKKM